MVAGQGLPQGSVLPPLLFIIYFTDLKAVLPNDVEVVMFAVSSVLQPSLQVNRPSCHARSRHTHHGMEQASYDDAEHREVRGGILCKQSAPNPVAADNPSG